jgi:hypothetical protein
MKDKRCRDTDVREKCDDTDGCDDGAEDMAIDAVQEKYGNYTIIE